MIQRRGQFFVTPRGKFRMAFDINGVRAHGTMGDKASTSPPNRMAASTASSP
jgi:hypothetical protein